MSEARTDSPSRGMLLGRGGAGNFGKNARPSGGAEDLVTPTLKSDTYTTGRGGSGNMAKNDPNHPEVARLAQDVQPPPQKEQPETQFHYGRGGAANFVAAPQAETKNGGAPKQKSHEGIAEKGKEFLDRLVNGNKK